jgi:RNA polymerase sigma-70 factor, ECF subfamily
MNYASDSCPNSEDALDRQVRSFVECRDLIQANIAALVRDTVLAEDVFQEVWLRFESVTRRGEVIESVPKWCRTAARLVAMEFWREQRRQIMVPDQELLSLIEKAYGEQDGREDQWRHKAEALRLCIDELPQRSRDLINRRYFHGDAVAALALQFGQSAGSVKTALCRLRLALSECARKRLIGDGAI